MIETVVFDLGGVLLDWDPRYLFRKLLPDEAAVDAFLRTVCPRDWHVRQDAGRSCAEAIAERTALFPAQAGLIDAFYTRFDEMIGGVIEDTAALVDELHARGMPLYALTNWPGDTFHHAGRFAVMARFRGVVVSGHEGVMKPDPRIFRILIDRYALRPAHTLFIDDVRDNVDAAARAGLRTHLFIGADDLRGRLAREGLIAPRRETRIGA